MGTTRYSPQEALSIVYNCAKKYQEELEDKKLLFLGMDKHKRIRCFEFTFEAGSYLHLTGLTVKKFM